MRLDDCQIFDVDAVFCSCAMLTVQTEFNECLRRIQCLIYDSVRIVLSTGCENTNVVHTAQLAQTLECEWTHIDIDCKVVYFD